MSELQSVFGRCSYGTAEDQMFAYFILWFRYLSTYKSQIHFLEFALNSCLKNIFNTRSQAVVVECMTVFICLSVEDSLLKRKCKFVSKLGSSKNLLISAFADDAAGELSLFQGR